MDTTTLNFYINTLSHHSNHTTEIPKNIVGLHHNLDKILLCQQTNPQFYINFHIIYSKLCAYNFTQCYQKKCISKENLQKIKDIDFEELKDTGVSGNQFTDLLKQNIAVVFNTVVVQLAEEHNIKITPKLKSFIDKYISGTLKKFDKIPIIIRDALDKHMNIGVLNPENSESLITERKKWIDCAVYNDTMMRYEWYTNKCYSNKKQMTLPLNSCHRNMLYLEPLHKLILIFFNFRYDNDMNITVYPNTPNLEVNENIKNREIAIFDLFILSGCLKQLFDMIEEVLNVDDSLTTNYNFIDNAITKFTIIPGLPIFSDFFVIPGNGNYHKYLFEILLLVYESNRSVKCYNKHDQANLPLYIIGDYIAHRIKRINYPNFDRIGCFKDFYQIDEVDNKDNDIRKSEISQSLYSYFLVDILNYINVPFVWNGKKKDFRNCVETTLLNLINIMYGDMKTGKTHIPDNSPEQIKDFFTKHNLKNDDETMSQKYKYDKLIEWTLLLTNYENVIYTDTVDFKSDTPTIKGTGVDTKSIVNLLKQLIGYSDKIDVMNVLITKTIKNVGDDMVVFIKLLFPLNPINIVSKYDYSSYILIINNIYQLKITDGHAEITGIFSHKYDLSSDIAFYDIVKNASINIGYEFASKPGLYIGRLNKQESTHVDIDTPVYIGTHCFNEEKFNITTIELPPTTIYIGDKAYYNSNIQIINIPDSVQEIGDASFSACTRMKSFFISGTASQLKKIGNDAFSRCSSLTIFNLPNSVREIGNSAFYSCYMMKEFNVDRNMSQLKKIGNNTFELCMGIPIFNLPHSVQEVGTKSFAQCNRLKKFIIDIDNSKLKNIGSNAFNETPIQEINIPSTVESIANDSFDDTINILNVNNSFNREIIPARYSDKIQILQQIEQKTSIPSPPSILMTGSGSVYWKRYMITNKKIYLKLCK